MRLFSDGEQLRVKRALGSDFDVGPVDGEDCDYCGRCSRPAAFTIPKQQHGSTLKTHACREHLYVWAHRDNPTLAERVRKYSAHDVTGYWRMVPLTADDVPDTFPINDQPCIAVGLDNMHRAHYVSATLKTVYIGQINDAGWVHAREPLELGHHTVEDYMQLVEEESAGWYAHPSVDKITDRAYDLEAAYHEEYAPSVDGDGSEVASDD